MTAAILQSSQIAPADVTNLRPEAAIIRARCPTMHALTAALQATLILAALLAPTTGLAQQDPQAELREARIELRLMQNKLDQWMLAAADREQQISTQRKADRQRTADLEVSLETSRRDLESLRQQLAELQDRLLETRKLNAGTQTRLDTELSAAHAQSRSLEQRLQSSQALLSERDVEIGRLRRQAVTIAESRNLADAAGSELRQQLTTEKSRTASLRQALFEEKLARRSASVAASPSVSPGRPPGSGTDDGRIDEASSANGDVTSTIAEAARWQAQAERLGDELNASNHQLQILTERCRSQQQELQLCRQRADGHLEGAAQLQQATQQASEAASRYARLLRASRRMPTPDPAIESALQQASQDMYAGQAQLAELQGASRLYTVRLEDTLSRIANRELGDYEYWLQLYDANRQVLDSPDRLLPGMTLIIP